jgi:hypothetical protein
MENIDNCKADLEVLCQDLQEARGENMQTLAYLYQTEPSLFDELVFEYGVNALEHCIYG